MRELDRRIATLRLRLAEISSREEQLRGLQRQFRGQLERITDFAVYQNGDLGSALSMAEEVDTRLAQTERTLHHLNAIRARVREELDALLLTRGVDAARSELAKLESQRQALEEELAALDQGTPLPLTAQTGGERRAELESQLAQIDAEMARLRRTISEASDAAARAVSTHVHGDQIELQKTQG